MFFKASVHLRAAAILKYEVGTVGIDVWTHRVRPLSFSGNLNVDVLFATADMIIDWSESDALIFVEVS